MQEMWGLGNQANLNSFDWEIPANIGFVGNGANKFTLHQAEWCKKFIRSTLKIHSVNAVISGGSPLGGVDQWAEDIADELGILKIIFRPKDQSWDGKYGYKARNLDIAKQSDKLFVLVSRNYPLNYSSRRFKFCYHCKTLLGEVGGHVKSGACWTGIKAREMGKNVRWVIV